MEDREYKIYQLVRELDYIKDDEERKNSLYLPLKIIGLKMGGHGYFLVLPDNQDKYFINGKIKEKYEKLGYPQPQQYGGKLGWTVEGHQNNEKLIVVFDQEQDKKTAQKILNNDTSNNLTILKGYVNPYPLKSFKYREDDVLIEAFMKEALSYQKNNQNGVAPKYSALSLYKTEGYNCNSFLGTIARRLNILNLNTNMPKFDPGDSHLIEEYYFKYETQE